MQLDRSIRRSPTGIRLLCGLAIVLPAVAHADPESCNTGTPAVPIDQFRTITGQGTFEMWPPNFRPAEALGVPLPSARDSTIYNSDPDQLPGFGGLEFFYGLDILESGGGTHLFMSFNTGFQIWNIGGAFATDPELLSARNGWLGDFHFFFIGATEEYFKIWDIAVIDPPASPGSTLVVLPGLGDVGTSIWSATNKSNPTQLYQDEGKTARQVAVANIGGRSYAFIANENSGVHVYDMTRAREIGPCYESTNPLPPNLCGGNSNPVWRGKLGPWPWGKTLFVSALQAQVGASTKHFLAISDRFPSNTLGAEIREILDITALPPTSSQVIEGLDTITRDVELFTINEASSGLDRHYLGAITGPASVALGDFEIYDVTACLDPAAVPTESCAFSATNRRYSQALGTLSSDGYLDFSESNGRPFLYQGFHTLCSKPTGTSGDNIEHLLDLKGLATGDPIVDLRGDSYTDPFASNPPRRIDYWSSYYDKATDGFSTFAPHSGKFHGQYFYRGAQTIFDVHEFTGEVAPEVTITETSTDRWLSTPGQIEWVFFSGSCNLPPATSWVWSADNAAGTPPGDPAPVIQSQGSSTTGVRGDLCAADTYPAATCPNRTIEVTAQADCNAQTATSNQLDVPLQDPRPFFDSIDILEVPEAAGPPPEYPLCQILNFEALDGMTNQIAGKPLTSFNWAITMPPSGDEFATCDATGGSTALVTCDQLTLTWDTQDVEVEDPTLIFADGFESGDTSAWSKIEPDGVSAGATFDVTLTASNEHGSIAQTTQLLIVALSDLVFLGNGFTIPPVPPADGIYDFTATAENATSFRWEFELDVGQPGDPGCTFVTPCETVTTTSAAVQYQWPMANLTGQDREVWLEISNCDAGQAPLSTMQVVENVTVINSVAPDLQEFKVILAGNPCQCFAGVCACPPGDVSFVVTIDGECDDLSFDWGDSQSSNGLACDDPPYVHNYPNTGVYTLEATACKDSLCDTLINLTNFSPASPVPLTIE